MEAADPMDGPRSPTARQRRRCSAHRKNGDPCQRWAIKGGTVCATHGGSAPQVKRAARLRLAELVDPSIGVLHHFLTRKEQFPQQALTAAKDVLDRAGYKPGESLHVDFYDQSAIDTTKLAVYSDEELALFQQLVNRALTASPAKALPAGKGHARGD